MPTNRLGRKSVWLLGEIMLQKEWISWSDLQSALQTQEVQREPIGRILVRQKVVTEDQVLRALAIQYGLDYVQLDQYWIEDEAVHSVSGEIARRYRFMPLERGKNYFKIAVSNPTNHFVQALLARLTGIHNIEMVMASPEDIERTLVRYYGCEEVEGESAVS